MTEFAMTKRSRFKYRSHVGNFEGMFVEDYIVRIMAKEAGVRALVCITTQTGSEAARRHKTDVTASAALAEGLTAGILFGGLIKVNQRVAIKFSGDGPLTKMVVEANNFGKVRGYVANPDVALPLHYGQPDVAAAIGGSGLLTVMKDLGVRDSGGKDLYEGVVAIENGAVDKELEHYMKKSEQTNTLIEIDSFVAADGSLAATGGLLVQALPGESAPVMAILAERIDDMPPLAELLNSGERPEDILVELFGGIDYDVLEKHDVKFHCSCSWGRSEKALLSLGRTELESLMADGEVEINCHFCYEQYLFSEEAIETILDKLPAS